MKFDLTTEGLVALSRWSGPQRAASRAGGRAKSNRPVRRGPVGVTKQEADRGFSKVPALRSVAKTGPYFQEGSVSSLDEAVRLIGKHPLGRDLDAATVNSIRAFLEALTGEPPAGFAARPALSPVRAQRLPWSPGDSPGDRPQRWLRSR